MAAWLLDRLKEFKDQTALVWRDRDCQYAQILASIETWRRHFEECGLRSGECVGVIGECSPDMCALLIALILNRNIVIPLAATEPGQRDRYLSIAGAEIVFEFEAGDAWTSFRRDKVEAHPLIEKLRNANEAGLILFTSGSTGESKASLLSFDRLLEKNEKRRTGHRTLIFLKLDHIGGINTLLHVLCNGGTLVCLGERTAEAVARAIERHRVELLPTTPTFLKMLLIAQAHRQHDLSSLKLITYGTEPMPASTLHSLREAFPNVRLKQTYGLSELGILPTISRDSESLWMKMGGEGFETKVVDGILWVRARSAMLGYLNAPSPFDKDGWFKTGDAVEVDGEYLRVLGRTSELINVGGEKVYPAEVESVLLQMDNVREATVYGKPNAVMGHVVVARASLHSPEERGHFEARMREFCRGRLADFQVPMFVELSAADHHTSRFKKKRR